MLCFPCTVDEVEECIGRESSENVLRWKKK